MLCACLGPVYGKYSRNASKLHERKETGKINLMPQNVSNSGDQTEWYINLNFSMTVMLGIWNNSKISHTKARRTAKNAFTTAHYLQFSGWTYKKLTVPCVKWQGCSHTWQPSHGVASEGCNICLMFPFGSVKLIHLRCLNKSGWARGQTRRTESLLQSRAIGSS